MNTEASALRILAVDDEPSILELLTLYLNEAGHVVETAASGDIALAQFSGAKWDLVITDRMMPGMSGDDVAHAIKAASPSTPVLMVSGLGETQLIARNPSVDGSLRKPFTKATLKEAIRSLIVRPNVASRTVGRRAILN